MTAFLSLCPCRKKLLLPKIGGPLRLGRLRLRDIELRSCGSRLSKRPVNRRILISFCTESKETVREDNERDALLKGLTDALILSFFACKTKSVLALDCLVHTAGALYRRRCTIRELQVLLTVKPFECGTMILTEMERDVLLSWSALVMLTMHEMTMTGNPESVVGEAVRMRDFVEQVLAQFRGGVTVQSMLKTQERVVEGSNPPPALKLMHLNSLIVLLTATSSGKQQGLEMPESDAERFVAAMEREDGQRGISLKSLVAFMGATLGSIFCIDRFIAAVTQGYTNGLTAREVVDGISEEEYEEACKELPVLDADTRGIAADISRQLFGRWVSIIFMTLAQCGVEHDRSSSQSGWAWAFDSELDMEMFEMTSLSTFVTNVLRKVATDDASPPDLSDRLQDVPDILEYLPKYKEEAEKQQAAMYGMSWVKVEDEEMRRTSPSVMAFWQMIFLVHLTYTKLQETRELDASLSSRSESST